MIETIEKLWTALLICSPLLLAVVIWLSRSSIGSTNEEKALFRTSLIIALVVGIIGMSEVKPGGWNLQLLFSPLFFTKWMFIGFSIIWPIVVFFELSKQEDTRRVAVIIVFLGISGLLISTSLATHAKDKNEDDRKYWNSFFENNEINRPRSELKSRLSKEGQATIGQHLRTGYTTTIESLEIISGICKEILDDIKRNHKADEKSRMLENTCNAGLSDIAKSSNIDREFIEKILLVKDKDGYPIDSSTIALNASTPVDILVRLSHLPKPPIYNLTLNSNTPPEILEIIACDDKEFDNVLLRIKTVSKKKRLSTVEADYLVNIREQLNTDNHMKEYIQMNAQRLLAGLKEADRSKEIINQAIQAVKKDDASSIAELLPEIKERRLSMRPREQVYYGMLLCITGNYEKAKWAYRDAEHVVSSYGQYNKEHLPQYIATLLLTRGAARLSDDKLLSVDELLTKMSTWYPNDTKIQEFTKIYPKLKQELEKFAVDDYHKPDKAPESMDTFLNFGIFD